MNDKELDDFFRKRSENPEIAYQGEDWEKLKRKLDGSSSSPNPKGSGNSKGWWTMLLGIAFVIGLGLGWSYWPSDSFNLKTVAEGRTADSSGNNSQPSRSDSDVGNDRAPTSHSAGGISDISRNSAQEQEGVMLQQESTADGKETRQNYLKSKRGPVSTIAQRSSMPLPSATNRVEAIQSDLLTTLDYERMSIELDLLFAKGQTATMEEPRAGKKKAGVRRFYTSLTLAPDVSALKIKDIQGVGNSIGINVEYFFHPNLSINAGGLYVFKTYQAGDAYSTGYVPAPSHVNGNCWVLDLPLNIRYYIINNDLSRWYVNTGLSSYLMLTEKYDLEYKSYNYSGSTYGNRLEVHHKNKHYLNIVNLGIGFERVLTDRLSLQVEPYIKLPLQGIGEGDISLKSAGAFIGLKYGW